MTINDRLIDEFKKHLAKINDPYLDIDTSTVSEDKLTGTETVNDGKWKPRYDYATWYYGMSRKERRKLIGKDSKFKQNIKKL